MSKWVKPGSMGKVAPGYDVRIVNNMGKEVARGEQGNIGVRCRPYWPPGLFEVSRCSALYTNPAATMALHSSFASAGRSLFIGLQLSPQLAEMLSLSLYEREERQVDLTVSHNSRSRDPEYIV